MGHLTTISAGLLQTASADPVVEKLLSESTEWHEYVKGPLAQTRERESRRLADYIPQGNEQSNYYEEDDKDNSSQQQQQTHYANFTNDFPDEFTEEPEETEEFESKYVQVEDVSLTLM